MVGRLSPHPNSQEQSDKTWLKGDQRLFTAGKHPPNSPPGGGDSDGGGGEGGVSLLETGEFPPIEQTQTCACDDKNTFREQTSSRCSKSAPEELRPQQLLAPCCPRRPRPVLQRRILQNCSLGRFFRLFSARNLVLLTDGTDELINFRPRRRERRAGEHVTPGLMRFLAR